MVYMEQRSGTISLSGARLCTLSIYLSMYPWSNRLLNLLDNRLIPLDSHLDSHLDSRLDSHLVSPPVNPLDSLRANLQGVRQAN